MRTDLSFGAWLRGRRAQLGSTMDEAASECGVSRRTWSEWESDGGEPSKVADVRSVARWAKTDVMQLFAMLAEAPVPAEDSSATG